MKLLLPTVKTDAYSYNTLYLQLLLFFVFLYNFEMMVPLQNIEELKARMVHNTSFKHEICTQVRFCFYMYQWHTGVLRTIQGL